MPQYPKSFLFGSRISNNRIYVVMASVAQTSFLVQQVGVIKINKEKIQLKYYLEKAVRVIFILYIILSRTKVLVFQTPH